MVNGICSASEWNAMKSDVECLIRESMFQGEKKKKRKQVLKK